MRSPHRVIRLASVVSLTCLATLGAQGRVWVVDAAGGTGAHTRSIEEAVRVAKDGDAILVRQGSYGVVKVVNKALTIVRDTRSGAASLLTVAIEKLAAGKSFTLRGFRVPSAATVTDCQGSVSIEDCTMQSGFGVGRSRAVTFSRCVVSAVSADGLSLHNSEVNAFDSTFTGGTVRHGLRVAYWSRVVASGCTFQGGPGLPGRILLGACYVKPTPGGNGVDMQTGRAELHGCTARGGAGAPARHPCPQGTPGVGIRNGAGTLLRTQLAPRRFTASATVRAGQPFQLDVRGVAGDNAFLVLNLAHDPVLVPGCKGAVIPALAGHDLVFLGTLQGTRLQVRGTAPASVPALSFARIATQLVVLRPGECVLGPAANVVVLDRRL